MDEVGCYRNKPAKGSALDIPAEPLTGFDSIFLARFARLGPLCGPLQRVQNPCEDPHSGPMQPFAKLNKSSPAARIPSPARENGHRTHPAPPDRALRAPTPAW